MSNTKENAPKPAETASQDEVHAAQNRPCAAATRDQPTILLKRSERVLSDVDDPPVQRATAQPRADASSSSDFKPTFSSGDVLCDRFRVMNFIGHGGMGEVYEAEDLELHEQVAIKTIRPELARDTQAVQRFKREINLARRVTHANVCRTFDVFRHSADLPDGSQCETTFLTMELLEGETLAGHLRRRGRMSSAEALPLVIQMTAALAAAHKEHVVHRDFKSQNVMLVRARNGEDIRAVVTDFGLARIASNEDGAQHTMGDFLGSPAYMAPEQVEGGEITGATDVYALGVVMYEMLTGRQPFVGETPLTTAVKRLKEPPPSPRVHVPDLDLKWAAVILQCLARNPADRFASAAEVAQALTAGQVENASRISRRWRGAALLAAILACAAVGYRTFVFKKSSGQPAVSTRAPAALPVIAPGIPDRPDVEPATKSRSVSRSPGPRVAPGNAPAATEATSLAAPAMKLFHDGNIDGAKKVLEQAAIKWSEAGDRASQGRALNTIASLLDAEGQLDAAQEQQDRALSMFAALNDKAGLAQAMDVAVHVLLHRADLNAAREKNEEQTRICRQLGDQDTMAEAEYDRGLLLEQADDLPGARLALAQSLEVRRALRHKERAAESLTAIAELSLYEGHPAESQSAAAQAAEDLGSRPAEKAVALGTEARALLAQAKYNDAERAIKQAELLLRSREGVYARSALAITRARLQAASGLGSTSGSSVNAPAEAEAEQELAKMIKSLKRDDLLALEFQARLALGEIEMKWGSSRSGRSRLAALERQARERGFALIARQAATARHGG